MKTRSKLTRNVTTLSFDQVVVIVYIPCLKCWVRRYIFCVNILHGPRALYVVEVLTHGLREINYIFARIAVMTKYLPIHLQSLVHIIRVIYMAYWRLIIILWYGEVCIYTPVTELGSWVFDPLEMVYLGVIYTFTEIFFKCLPGLPVLFLHNFYANSPNIRCFFFLFTSLSVGYVNLRPLILLQYSW